MSFFIPKSPDDLSNYKKLFEEVSAEYASELLTLLPYEASNFIIDKIRERVGEKVVDFENWLISEGYETSSNYDWRWLFWSTEQRSNSINELIGTLQERAALVGGRYTDIVEWMNNISFQIAINPSVYENNRVFRAITETFQVVLGIVTIMSRATEEAGKELDETGPLFDMINLGADYAKELLIIVKDFVTKHKEHADLGISELSQGVVDHDSQHMANLFMHFGNDLKRYEPMLTKKLLISDLSNDIFAYAAYYRLLLKLRLRREDSSDLDRVTQDDILRTFPPVRSGIDVVVNVDINGTPNYINIESFVVLRTLILNAWGAVEYNIKQNELPAEGSGNIDVQISGVSGSELFNSLNNEFVSSIRATEEIDPNGRYTLFRVTNSITEKGEETLLKEFNRYVDDITKDPNAYGSHGLQLGIYMTRSENQNQHREVYFMGITFTGEEGNRKANIYMVCPVN